MLPMARIVLVKYKRSKDLWRRELLAAPAAADKPRNKAYLPLQQPEETTAAVTSGPFSSLHGIALFKLAPASLNTDDFSLGNARRQGASGHLVS